MKKICLSILSGLCLTGLLFSVGCKKEEASSPPSDNKPPATETQPIKIGVLLPLSGDAKIYGEEMQKGIELAFSQEAQKPSGLKIEPVTEDDAGVPVTAVSGFQKLVEIDHVPAVIGGAMSSTAGPIVPIALEKKVVLISPAASAPSLCKPGGYFFRVWPSDVYEATALAHLAADKLGLKTAAVIYVNNDYGKGASQVFAREFEAAGGRVVLNEGYAQNATDFRTILTKTRALNPDTIYIPGYYKEIANLLRQAKELNVKAQFLGGVGFQEPKILELVGDAADGTIYTTPYYDPNVTNAVTKSFVEAYRQKYRNTPGIFAAHSYDAARVLIYALHTTDGTGEAIRKALLGLKSFPGATGDLTFTATGDVVKPVAFHIVRDGKFEPFTPP